MTNNYFAEGLKNLQRIDWQIPFCFLSKTTEELSLICPEANLPTQTLPCEYGWRTFRIGGTLDFTIVGILANLSGLLAAGGIIIFAVSTYNTDYILIKETALKLASEVLAASGYNIITNGKSNVSRETSLFPFVTYP